MRGSYLKTLVLTATLGCLIGSAPAQILVTGSGFGPEGFASPPTVANGWSTLLIAGGAGDLVARVPMDTDVNTRTAASMVTALPTVTVGNPLNANNLAAYNSVLSAIQTTPTGVKYSVLLATMRNDTLSPISSFTLAYSLGRNDAAGTTPTEEIPGQQVYISSTGLMGSWVRIPALDTAAPGDSGPKSATVALPVTWAPGGTAYLLWVDDNGSPNRDNLTTEEVGYTIDDVQISNLVGPQPPVITSQPSSVTVDERQVATLSVTATGADLMYQWFRNPSTPIVGATSPTFVVTNLSGASKYPWSNPSDNGTYHVVVSGSAGAPQTSGNATVTVTPDTTPPTFVYATCGTTPDQFILVMSEPLNNDNNTVRDTFAWKIEDIAGGPDLPINSIDYTDDGVSTTIVFNTSGRNPATGYRIGLTDDANMIDTAKTPNALSHALITGVKCFEIANPIVNLTNHSWQVEDSGTDLGTAWRSVSYVDSGWPKSGPGLFDAKRAASGNPPTTPWCRATVGGQNVNTCINLSNSVAGGPQISSAYFRTHFSFAGAPAGTVFALRMYLDDGAMFYLNGQELLRKDMPTGPITYASLSPRTIGDAALESTNVYAGGLLVSGDNVLAASAHQVNLTSSDLTFGLQVNKLTAVPPTTLTIVDNGNGTVNVSWTPAIGTLKSSTSVVAPLGTWSTVGTTSPQTVAKTASQKFFVVQGPPEP
jgi:hypothetical protein